jgi:hypothetical protein
MAMAKRHDLSRDYGRLMLVMRRLVREEFSVTIHLDAPEAPEELLAFAERSNNFMLKEMATELEPMLVEREAQPDDLLPEPEQSEENVTYYRGAPVKKATRSESSAEASHGEPTRIYRGQKVGK